MWVCSLITKLLGKKLRGFVNILLPSGTYAGKSHSATGANVIQNVLKSQKFLLHSYGSAIWSCDDEIEFIPKLL